MKTRCVHTKVKLRVINHLKSNYATRRLNLIFDS
jgi:hypothetical protein